LLVLASFERKWV